MVSLLSSLAPTLFAFLLSSLPAFLGEEIGLDAEGSVVAGLGLLISSGSLGESDFKDGKEALLSDGDETLLAGFPDINNLLLSDLDDHVQSLDLAAEDLSHPQGLVHKLFGSLDSHERLALSEEQGECPRDVFAWVGKGVP